MVAPKGNLGGQPEDPFSAILRMLGELFTGQGAPNTMMEPSSTQAKSPPKTGWEAQIEGFPNLDFGKPSYTEQQTGVEIPARRQMREEAAVRRESPGKQFRYPQIDPWPAATPEQDLQQLAMPRYGAQGDAPGVGNLERSLGDILRETPTPRPFTQTPVPAIAGPRPAGEPVPMPMMSPESDRRAGLARQQQKMETLRALAMETPQDALAAQNTTYPPSPQGFGPGGSQINDPVVEYNMGAPMTPAELAMASQMTEQQAALQMADMNQRAKTGFSLGETLRLLAATAPQEPTATTGWGAQLETGPIRTLPGNEQDRLPQEGVTRKAKTSGAPDLNRGFKGARKGPSVNTGTVSPTRYSNTTTRTKKQRD